MCTKDRGDSQTLGPPTVGNGCPHSHISAEAITLHGQLRSYILVLLSAVCAHFSHLTATPAIEMDDAVFSAIVRVGPTKVSN